MRDATTYRGYRRNKARTERAFPAWRETVAAAANAKANIASRANLANGAREAAAKAIVNMVRNSGVPVRVAAAKAMLDFYLVEAKRTRAVSRIIRELRTQVEA